MEEQVKVDQFLRKIRGKQRNWRAVNPSEHNDAVNTLNMLLCHVLGPDYLDQIKRIIPFATVDTSERARITKEIAKAAVKAIGQFTWRRQNDTSRRRAKGLQPREGDEIVGKIIVTV
jgi:hypothetical protein